MVNELQREAVQRLVAIQQDYDVLGEVAFDKKYGDKVMSVELRGYQAVLMEALLNACSGGNSFILVDRVITAGLYVVVKDIAESYMKTFS